MWRSGYFAFHISTSLSTMPLLPPLRSHITRSAAKLGTDTPNRADVERPNRIDFKLLESGIWIPPIKDTADSEAIFLFGSCSARFASVRDVASVNLSAAWLPDIPDISEKLFR